MGYPIAKNSDGMVQRFKVEVDSSRLLKRYLEIAIPTVLESNEEILVRLIKKDEDNRFGIPSVVNPILPHAEKKLFPVMLIGGWFKPKKGERRKSFWSVPENVGVKPPQYKIFRTNKSRPATKPAIQYILAQIKKNWREWEKRFIETYGDGYHYAFMRSDGTVHVGFGFQSCGCFPDQLAITLVHMYYGK